MITPFRCPVCEKPASKSDPQLQSHFPFCSDRCRKVDFHRWFDGRYAIVEDIDPQIAQFMADDPDITIQGEGIGGRHGEQ